MARYDASGMGGGGGGEPVWCRDTGGSSNACVPLPLWKKKDEKSRGFALMDVETCRVQRRYESQISRDEDLEALVRRPGGIIYRAGSSRRLKREVKPGIGGLRLKKRQRTERSNASLE
jgi:hypothetical protein